jgi:tetratricopeptide (TPR) repeat protein
MLTYQYDLADQSFNHAYMIYPGDTTTLKNIGQFIKIRTEYEHAVEVSEKNRDLKNLYPALIRRAHYYYWCKSYKQALADVNACIKIAPDSTRLYILRGDIEDDGEKKENLALKDYSHAIQLQPSNAVVYYERGVIYKRLGQLQKALADYQKSIGLSPHPYTYNNIGGIYMDLKMYKKAYDEFKLAFKISKPSDSSYYGEHMRMAMFYLKKKKP